ncbi:acetyl-CoA carboxylase biotin carboxylase subunit family protein [Gemella sanguinis]|uniref:ATP-grasp domain-containing protein n=1 Tax=Gemella sanguinis TaxID=84135 RepID=UPI0026EDBDED|nr:carbamoyl phosphate synthase large subunit [Gemella sanguinis]
MNYLLISPNFPKSQEYFAKRLSEKGITVLGIGTESYDELSPRLQEVITEYFKVNNLEDYNEVLKAVAFLTYKHGKIDRVESNNEYWLELDAKIREDFNIDGVKPSQLLLTKYKSRMKDVFRKAGARVVEGLSISNKEELAPTIETLGLPVIAKPDNGVGAANTYKLFTQEDVENFRNTWDESVSYFLEQYIDNAVLCTYDGLIHSEGNVVFDTSFTYSLPTLELINNAQDYYTDIEPKIDEKLVELGKNIVKEFGMKERFFHIEFFKLPDGEYIALEYNNRIAGGITIDLYNYAYNCDLYELYAKVVNGEEVPKYETDNYTATVSRRNKYNYKYSEDDVNIEYNEKIRMVEYVPKVFAEAMGDVIFIVTVGSKEELIEIIDFIQEKID